MNRNKKRPVIICRCNEVSREVIEEAIRNGAKTLNEIYDATTAGVGACGGSCRRKLKPFLDHYFQTGEFPSVITELPMMPSDSDSDPGSSDDSGCT